MKPHRQVFAVHAPWVWCVGTALVVSTITGVIVTAQQSPDPQSSRPTFRTDVNAVLTDLRVVDRNGKFVDDLTKDDFRVFEDDHEQAVTTFSLVNIPIPVAAEIATVPAVAPDVVSNANADEGRLYMIVLDDLEEENESKPLYQKYRAQTVRALARDFVEHHLGPNDRAALIATSNRRELTVEFTNDRRRLLTAIDKFEGAFGQVAMGFACGFSGCVPVRDNLHTVMLNLKSLANWMSGINGRRKALVFVGDRLGRSKNELILDLPQQEAIDIQYFLEAAARANVTLYSIDPVGEPTGKPGNIKPLPLDDLAQFDFDRTSSLEVVSEETGGFAATHTNDFATAFDRVVEESSSYYLLGYVSTNKLQDGKFRKIRYQVTRPGLKVQGRSGYATVKPDTRTTATSALSDTLTDLVRSPIPMNMGLSLSVVATPFRRDASMASVGIVVEARASDLFFTNQDAKFNGSMELAIIAADVDGKVKGSERGTLTMKLSEGTRNAVAANGVRVVSSLDLKPGRYVLKVAVTDAGGGTNRGTVSYDVNVPDYSKAKLSMSGIAVTSAVASRTATKGSDAALARWKESLVTAPTTMRTFASDDTLRAYAEVYDNDRTKDHSVNVVTSVRDADGRSVFSQAQSFPFKTAGSGGTTKYGVTTEIVLDLMPPGEYVLSVEATHSNKSISPDSRQVPISIR